MTLADYLHAFTWSQAELARQADISEHCVRRALAGERISRRNAEKIITALDRRFQAQGAKAHITIGSIQGLALADLHHAPNGTRVKGIDG